jgi:glycosyltransferase involved in cell wall biosynthesis
LWASELSRDFQPRGDGDLGAGAGVLIVPSRSEPFGMVILEAMQHRVPVIYPAASGAAEVLTSGVKIDPSDIDAIGEQVSRLLGELTEWETLVRDQAREIDAYPARDYDDRLVAASRSAAGERAKTQA